MEHRGIEFAVVRTFPKGWLWSVRQDDGDKAGTSRDRDEAIEKAKRYFDYLIRHRAEMHCVR